LHQPRYITENHWHIEDLPLILAGPILRRTEPDNVTVWLALKESRSVTLQIYATLEGNIINNPILEGQAVTVQLGKYLHLVAVTAKPFGNQELEAEQIYAYNIFLGNNQENLATALNTQEIEVSLSYFPHQLPTFCLPPNNLDHLQIVHGSCRKPHGGERDALATLDYLLQKSCFNPNYRPHQLFLTGDQIYGDDVADPFLETVQALEKVLFGRSEDLPVNYGYIKSEELKPGKRTPIAEDEGGFTAMLHNQAEKSKSHLFSFGEYACAYLLTWSSVLMNDRFISGKRKYKNRKLAKRWDKEVKASAEFASTLGRVRRVLANIPTYMICDDHDISDDWYLNREWCDRVLSKPFGRRVVQNGLLAYALFQAWGNTPEQFTKGKPGEKLLVAAAKWFASSQTDTSAWEEVGKYLGIPLIDEQTQLPQLEADEDVLILQQDTQSLRWNYVIRSFKHEVIVLDTRTWRGYPIGNNNKNDPPMLLCPRGFREQLEEPLEQTEQLNKYGKTKIEATLVVLPTNLVALAGIDVIQHWSLKNGHVFKSDVGDSWNFNREAFSRLLHCLGQKRDKVIILTGDIHYSCAVRLNYWYGLENQYSAIVQLTSSAIKNSEWTTRVIHSRIKNLVPERSEYWVAWEEPHELIEVPLNRSFWENIIPGNRRKLKAWQLALKQRQSLPDWRYQLHWIPRQKAQPVTTTELHLHHSTSFLDKLLSKLLLWCWRDRIFQEGSEVVGRNNLSMVSFEWSDINTEKAVIQDTYWYPPWNVNAIVKSRYFAPLGRRTPPLI
jgi:hypothetical protein